MGILDDLKNLFNSSNKKDGKNNNLLRNIVILGMIGTLLLLFGDIFIDKDSKNQESPVYQVSKDLQMDQDYEAKLTSQLEEIISLIKGVGKVKANIYITGYTEYEYEYNSSKINKITNEVDQNGGHREIVEDNLERELVLTRDATGNEKPVIRKEIFPEIRGVLIVAQGAENSQIKYEIINSVSSLLNIPVHRISVLPYERR